jgi:hypothetical protein
MLRAGWRAGFRRGPERPKAPAGDDAMRTRLAALLAGLALAAAPAAAELIEYRLPDGSTGYTDEPARVPWGAQIVSAREESAPSQARAEPAPAAREAAEPSSEVAASAPDPDAEALAAAAWRQRARQAQEAVREAQIRVEARERIYSDCRGRENYWNWHYGHYDDRRYRNPGLESSCDDEAEALDAAREALAEAESYAADGLYEDCRRSGCLPGWIR